MRPPRMAVTAMSNAPSSKTVAIAFRVPVDTYGIILRKATKRGMKPSEWLRKRVIYDVSRKHEGVR